MPVEARPILDRTNLHFTSASEALINYSGKEEVQIQLSGKQNPITVLVCDIDKDAIRGGDFIWGLHSV